MHIPVSQNLAAHTNYVIGRPRTFPDRPPLKPLLQISFNIDTHTQNSLLGLILAICDFKLVDDAVGVRIGFVLASQAPVCQGIPYAG